MLFPTFKYKCCYTNHNTHDYSQTRNLNSIFSRINNNYPKSWFYLKSFIFTLKNSEFEDKIICFSVIAMHFFRTILFITC